MSEQLLERCCGLDVHSRTVVACRLTPEGQEVRTFGTTTHELLALGDWLAEGWLRAGRDGEYGLVLEARL